MPQWAQFLIFFSIITSVYSAGHYYLYTWFVRWAEPSPPIRRILRLCFLLLVISFPAGRFLAQVDFNPFTYGLTLVASVWMGMALYFLLLALVLDLFLIFTRLFSSLFAVAVRFSLATRKVMVAGVVVGVLLIGWIAWQEAHHLGVTRLEIPLRGLPPEMDGFSLAQVSDVHYGMLMENGKLSRIVDKVNELHPDVVVITGDLVDEGVSHMEEMALPLERLRAKVGVFAVTGNHEYYAGVNRAVNIMKSAGIQVLRNELKVLPFGLQLLGVDDPTGTRRVGEPIPEFEKLLSALDSQKPAILLYHQPILFEKAASYGVGLQLSGHTHGGQLFPIRYISRLVYPRTPGLHQIGESILFVSRGAGTWGPPLRLGSPPEIVYIRLRSPQKK